MVLICNCQATCLKRGNIYHHKHLDSSRNVYNTTCFLKIWEYQDDCNNESRTHWLLIAISIQTTSIKESGIVLYKIQTFLWITSYYASGMINFWISCTSLAPYLWCFDDLFFSKIPANKSMKALCYSRETSAFHSSVNICL